MVEPAIKYYQVTFYTQWLVLFRNDDKCETVGDQI